MNIEIDVIYNEDCIEGMKKLPDGSVDLIVTDPPYGINFKSNCRKESYDKIKNDDSLHFLNDLFSNCHRVLKDNTAIYCFCSWHNIDEFKHQFEKYFKLKNILIWEKNNTSMGDLKGSYAPKYEMILFGHKGRRLIEDFRHPDVIKAKRTGNTLHPTQKPVELLQLFIETSSKENDIVLDPFIGSGSTCVAAVNTNRHYIGYELEEKHFDTACQRLDEVESKIFKNGVSCEDI